MPRVTGGNGPMRRPGGAPGGGGGGVQVFSNHSSDDEGGADVGNVTGGGSAGWGRGMGKPPTGGGDTRAWQGGGGGGGAGGGGGQSDQAAAALFEAYMAAGAALGDDLGKDQVFEQGLSRVRDCLSNVDSSCCLICLNHIRPTEAVWHCERGCYTVLHLVCIQEWARSQVDAAKAKAAVRLSQFPAAGDAAAAVAEWGCPKCRSTYPAAGIPSTYTCFCGKATNPEFDPWVAPHSCGEVCGKPLPGGCGHTCLLLCHPGPCPPCPLVVDAACHCGARRLKRRCGHHEFSCEGVCGAKLECGHRCPDVCHPDDCAPCRVPGDFRCRCGAESRRLACGERDFQCGRVCGKALACGSHTCERVCHAGPCGECPFAGVRTCPCGKVEHVGMGCTDKVPSCGATCGKLLPCGVHTCPDRCHQGECSATCRGPAIKSCRCGKSQKEVLCFQEFTCERRCNEMRACGRHPCKRRCCDGNCPPCEEMCGRWLKCRNHRCPAPCHSGPCRPCPLTSTVTCACGRASCTLPCGAEDKAEPPHCAAPCAVPRLCRHAPSLPRHRCHFGPCPPCPQPCATPLTCGHACGVPQCHDPPPPPVPEFTKPAPPKAPSVAAAAAAAAAGGGADGVSGGSSKKKLNGAAAVDVVAAVGPAVAAPASLAAQMLAAAAASGQMPSACPPCSVLQQVTCVGGHTKRDLPCASARPFACGAPCGRPLSCGNHSCALPCHAVAYDPITIARAAATAAAGGAAAADPALPRPCRQCESRCDRPRPSGCIHACPLACHRGPCPRCEAPVRHGCMCGKATLSVPCADLGAAAAAVAAGGSSEALSCGKPCHRQLPYCPHPCKALCHAGACPDPAGCAAEVSVRCACPAKRRAKWKCSEVQAALVASGRPRLYDDSAHAPRLLPCDADCEKARAKGEAAGGADNKGAGAAASGKAAAKGASAAMVASASTDSLGEEAAAATAAGGKAAAAAAAAGAGGKQGKLTRAEREALAAKREEERKREERRHAIIRLVMLALLAGLAVLMVLGARSLLLALDARARAKWAPGKP